MEHQVDTSENIYEQLQGLYQADPEAFERLRRALIQDALDNVPENLKPKVYGMQLRIEAHLKKYKDPVARMNAMVEIFWQQFREFQEVLNDPLQVLEKRRRCGTVAKVIPFRRHSGSH